MAGTERELPATPEAALVELGCEWLDGANYAHDRVGEYDLTHGAEAVARMVLADPRGWREALGWAHEWVSHPHGYRCTRCGIRVGLPESPELCAGVPS